MVRQQREGRSDEAGADNHSYWKRTERGREEQDRNKRWRQEGTQEILKHLKKYNTGKLTINKYIYIYIPITWGKKSRPQCIFSLTMFSLIKQSHVNQKQRPVWFVEHDKHTQNNGIATWQQPVCYIILTVLDNRIGLYDIASYQYPQINYNKKLSQLLWLSGLTHKDDFHLVQWCLHWLTNNPKVQIRIKT